MTATGKEEKSAAAASRFGRHLASLHSLRLIKERVVLSRLESLVARAPDAAAERAIAGIVTEATSQRDEIEDVLLAWRRILTERSRAPRDPGLGGAVPFRDMLLGLVSAKRRAAEVYDAAAGDCPDPALADRLRRLAEQDIEHASILEEIVARL